MRFQFACVALLMLTVSANAQDKPKLIAGADVENQWPSAAGPNGSWAVKTADVVPTEWSVSADLNIAWKTELPEGGQSNIAVWKDRLFLTINKPLTQINKPAEAVGTDIVCYCINANDGRIIWAADLEGQKPMQHSGLFSDNTSPTPITDGQNVWFINAGGSMACFGIDGAMKWKRTFETRTRHNAKQCEPMLIGNWLLHVEMRDSADKKRRPMLAEPFQRKSKPTDWPWTFIRAFDASSGKPLWTCDAGTSIHNTPRIGFIGDNPVVFHARGGGHAPPETPYGFSLSDLDKTQPGATLWDAEMKGGLAYCVSHFDGQFAYAFSNSQLNLLDINSGKVARSISLKQDVDVRLYDTSTEKYVLTKATTFPLQKEPAADAAKAKGKRKGKAKPVKSQPTNQTNIVVGDYCLFMSYTDHCVCRINTKTGKVEYLQVPLQVQQPDVGQREKLWDKHIPADTLNSRGIDTGADKRTKGNGWGHVTSASPIAVNNYVFFSTMLGTVYVIDYTMPVFDESALVSVNDLGPAGKTWSLSSLSYANGKLYHRGVKHVIGISIE